MGEKKVVKRILKFLLNSSLITLIVQTPKEVEYFKSITKKCKIIFIPYCCDFETDIPAYNSRSKYIFTGGYTYRDYLLIIECAKYHPAHHFILVISSLNINSFPSILPENVTIFRDVERTLFYSIAKGSAIVIIPLKQDVGASGQMLCLNAMALGKPIIYTDVTSINYYFEHNKSGIPYILGNKDSLNLALDTMLSMSASELNDMSENARNNYLNFYTINMRDKKLLQILME